MPALDAKRVVNRFFVRQAAKALSPEKLNALLLKIRKGADSSVSLKQWIEVLLLLGGWRVEPFIGLVKMYGYKGEEDSPNSKTDKDAAKTQEQYELMKGLEVSQLPTHPQVGKRYTMDVTKPTGEGWAYDLIGFTFKEWIGAKGLRFTSPEGKIFEHIRDKYDSDTRVNVTEDPMKLPYYELVSWLRKSTKMLEQVSNYLGMETHESQRENAKPRTRDGTGTCACCFRNIKLKMRGSQLPVMVLHGYKRPGWGQVHGSCFGVDYPPFELATDGTKALVAYLQKNVERCEQEIKDIQSGTHKGIYVQTGGGAYSKKMEHVTPEDPRWATVSETQIHKDEQLIKSLHGDIKLLQGLIQRWVLAELPREGDRIKPPPALLT
jgi:hypothetical protein